MTNNNQSDTQSQYHLKPSQRSIKGLRSMGPAERKYWDTLRSIAMHFADSYCYSHIALPALEQASLFSRTLGKNADIVQDELVELEDHEGNTLTASPSVRIPLARAYVENGLYELQQPVKLYTEGMLIKADYSQKERLRQHYHCTFAAFGGTDPLLDAQLMFITYKQLQAIGLDSIMVQINSIGSSESQDEYRKALVEFLRSIRSELTEDQKKLITKEPHTIFAELHETDHPALASAPQMVDFLDEAGQQHFMKVLEYLDELDVPYFLTNTLCADSDYATHTQFHIVAELEEGTSKPLVTGGRFDDLLTLMIEAPVPAVSATLHYDRILNALHTAQVEQKFHKKCDVFVAQIGEEAKKRSIRLFEELRAHGLMVAEDLAQDGLKAQLSAAEVCGVKFALILGQKEIIDGTIMVRDMENGIQEIIDFQKIIPEITKRLQKHEAVTKKAA